LFTHNRFWQTLDATTELVKGFIKAFHLRSNLLAIVV
jgi:hypothetical protein